MKVPLYIKESMKNILRHAFTFLSVILVCTCQNTVKVQNFPTHSIHIYPSGNVDYVFKNGALCQKRPEFTEYKNAKKGVKLTEYFELYSEPEKRWENVRNLNPHHLAIESAVFDLCFEYGSGNISRSTYEKNLSDYREIRKRLFPQWEIDAINSYGKHALFPIGRVQIGQTTCNDFDRFGFKRREGEDVQGWKWIYYTAGKGREQWTFHVNKSCVFSSISFERHIWDVLPYEWVIAGFSWKLSYNQWIQTLEYLGFKIVRKRINKRARFFTADLRGIKTHPYPISVTIEFDRDKNHSVNDRDSASRIRVALLD